MTRRKLTTASLTAALEWLGPISVREAADALQCSVRHVQRIRGGIGYDDEGRLNLRHTRTVKPPNPVVVAVRTIAAEVGDGLSAEWLCEQTGYGRRAVYDALRALGFRSRRGAGALWWRDAAMAAK